MRTGSSHLMSAGWSARKKKLCTPGVRLAATEGRMEPTKLPRWGVPVVVMPVRKRVMLMGRMSARNGGEELTQQCCERGEQKLDDAVAQRHQRAQPQRAHHPSDHQAHHNEKAPGLDARDHVRLFPGQQAHQTMCFLGLRRLPKLTGTGLA